MILIEENLSTVTVCRAKKVPTFDLGTKMPSEKKNVFEQ